VPLFFAVSLAWAAMVTIVLMCPVISHSVSSLSRR